MTTKLERMIDEQKYPEVIALYEWSHNFDYPSPMSLYLDLIGYSEEQLGMNLCSEKLPSLGYLELSYLADALKEYTNSPQDVYEFVEELLEAEYGDVDEYEEESVD